MHVIVLYTFIFIFISSYGHNRTCHFASAILYCTFFPNCFYSSTTNAVHSMQLGDKSTFQKLGTQKFRLFRFSISPQDNHLIVPFSAKVQTN